MYRDDAETRDDIASLEQTFSKLSVGSLSKKLAFMVVSYADLRGAFLAYRDAFNGLEPRVAEYGAEIEQLGKLTADHPVIKSLLDELPKRVRTENAKQAAEHLRAKSAHDEQAVSDEWRAIQSIPERARCKVIADKLSMKLRTIQQHVSNAGLRKKRT